MQTVKEMNLPNKITIFRVCMIPIFLVFMLVHKIPNNEILALIVFIIACASDGLDGYLARKNNMVTDFGKFMDPLADKLLVCSALICFVEQAKIPAWIVIVIISREFIISGFRLVAANKGLVIAASTWAKSKTVVQMIMCILFIVSIDNQVIELLEQISMYLALALTLISLFEYLYKNRKVLTEGSR